MNKKHYDYVEKIIDWADERGLNKAEILPMQLEKSREENAELTQAITKYELGNKDAIVEIKDAVGDINGEKNLEKAINSYLADYFVFIDKANDNKFLSEEANDKLVEFLIEDYKEGDEIGKGLALLAKILKDAAKEK